MNGRRWLLCGVLCLGALSGVAHGGEVISPNAATVRLADSPKGRLAETRRHEIPYAAGEHSVGYAPAGNELQARGPVALEVLGDGVFRIADSLKRAFFEARVKKGKAIELRRVGSLPRRHDGRSSALPVSARAVRTSAEDAAVVFGGDSGPRVEIATGRPLATARVVGVDRYGRAFVLLEMFRALGRPEVDRQVIVIDPQGVLVAKMALPRPSPVTPWTELFLAADGALYRLDAAPEMLRIVRYEVRP